MVSHERSDRTLECSSMMKECDVHIVYCIHCAYRIWLQLFVATVMKVVI